MQRDARGGLVRIVEADSPAQRAGIVAGDTITAVDGHRLSDVFDWLWSSEADRIEVTVESNGIERSVVLSRDEDEPWGIEFVQLLFDSTRLCKNQCAFCFMDQLPEGVRDSLKLKDDDFRLSFYEGNFVTLTNIDTQDLARIIEQQLSPLFVSLHAADPHVRQRLLGSRHARGLEVFEHLAAAGIEMHISIVLVPGINDGEVLDETLTYLERYRPQVLSVGIVPVAYTRYTTDIAGNQPSSYNDVEASVRVIAQVQSYQFKSREQTDSTWAYLADEFYIYARAPFPTTEWYDGYPQYENGIGIVHTFIEDIRSHYDGLTAALERLDELSEAITIVTGQLTTETMLGTLSALRAGGKARLLPVENRFFGGNVNVTGLLTGSDLVEAISYDNSRLEKPTTYVIPWTIFNDDEVTLDDYTPQRIAEETGACVMFVSDDARGLLEAIEEVTP